MNSSSHRREVGDWILEEEIGKGAQAIVYRGVNKKSNQVAAIKEFCLENYDEAAVKQIYAEANIIKRLQHPFIIPLLDSFTVNNCFYVAYKYIARGSLYKAIKKNVFSNDAARAIIQKVLLGLNHIHNKGVIHRDIKADNILIDDDNAIQITDFGISLIDSNSDGDDNNTGSSYWMAPERIELKPPTTKSDIWSVGCLTLELLTGKPPYWKLPPLSALFHISTDEVVPYEDIHHNITEDCRRFINECFVKDPEKRKSAEELLRHPWIKRGVVSKQPTHQAKSALSTSEVAFKEVNPLDTLDMSAAIDGLFSTLHAETKEKRLSTLSRSRQDALSNTFHSRSSSSNFSQNGSLLSRRLSGTGTLRSVYKDNTLLESILLSKLHIISEYKHHSLDVIKKELEFIVTSIQDSKETCGILITNNTPYILITFINTHFNETALCCDALKILYELMKADKQIQTGLLMMGLTTIITRYISQYFESSSAQLSKNQAIDTSRTPSEAQLMTVVVSMLEMLFSNQGPILDILFTCGLVNSAIQLLDSINIDYVYSGITCLLQITRNLTTISSDIIHEIFFNTGIIKFLFSGLIFTNSLSTLFSFHTATRLLDLLILYTEKDNDSFIHAILTNNGLNTVVYALRLTEKDIQSSASRLSLSTSTTLIEYKQRVLQLIYNLQLLHPGLFDSNLLPILLPILQSNHPDLIQLDVKLILDLLEHDQANRLLVTAVNNHILTILRSLVMTAQGDILVSSIHLLLYIGHVCTVPSSIQKSLYSHFKMTSSFDLLFDNINNEAVSHEIFSFLNDCRVYDPTFFLKYCCTPETIKKLTSCFIQSCDNNCDVVLQAFLTFVKSIPDVLIDFGLNIKLMEKVMSNIAEGNAMNQIASLQLLAFILKVIPDKPRFEIMFNIPVVARNVRVTKSNRSYLNSLFSVL